MVGSFKVGDLDLDEREYRTYLIVTEAIKEQVVPRCEKLELEIHGEKGNNGLKSKVARISGASKAMGLLITGIILYIITLNVLF